MSEPEQTPSVGELIAAVGRLIIYLGLFGVFAFIAWSLLTA